MTRSACDSADANRAACSISLCSAFFRSSCISSCFLVSLSVRLAKCSLYCDSMNRECLSATIRSCSLWRSSASFSCSNNCARLSSTCGSVSIGASPCEISNCCAVCDPAFVCAGASCVPCSAVSATYCVPCSSVVATACDACVCLAFNIV